VTICGKCHQPYDETAEYPHVCIPSAQELERRRQNQALGEVADAAWGLHQTMRPGATAPTPTQILSHDPKDAHIADLREQLRCANDQIRRLTDEILRLTSIAYAPMRPVSAPASIDESDANIDVAIEGEPDLPIDVAGLNEIAELFGAG
jgi:hypothetical protein